MIKLLLVYYAALSLITMTAYWWDKRAANRGKWRTRERTLHAWALAGGWPGAFAAQNLFKHKRRKRAFVAITWLAAIAHIAVWIAVVTLATPDR